MGCPLRDHCKDCCEDCDTEKQSDKMADLIEALMLEDDERKLHFD